MPAARGSTTASPTDAKRPQPPPPEAGLPDATERHDRIGTSSPPAVIWLVPEKYPDIPAYENSEVVPAVQRFGAAWAEKVFTVEGYDFETTNEIMEKSLAAGADLADLDVPIFAVAASAASNLHGWWKGSVPLHHLPWEIIIDGSVHGGLSIAGGFTGAALGGLVFGPAGAVVFGRVGGIAALFGAEFTGRTVRKIYYRKQLRATSEQAEAFKRVLEMAMEEKIGRRRR